MYAYTTTVRLIPFTVTWSRKVVVFLYRSLYLSRSVCCRHCDHKLDLLPANGNSITMHATTQAVCVCVCLVLLFYKFTKPSLITLMKAFSTISGCVRCKNREIYIGGRTVPLRGKCVQNSNNHNIDDATDIEAHSTAVGTFVNHLQASRCLYCAVRFDDKSWLNP